MSMRDSSQFPRFTTAEMTRRHAGVAAMMEEQGLDALLVYGQGRFSSDVYWLTDWPGGREAYVLFQKDAPPVVLVQLYNHVPMARVLSVIEDVRWAGANTAGSAAALLKERHRAGTRIGLVGSIDWKAFRTIAGTVGEEVLVDAGAAFREMRRCRSDEEITRIALASELTDRSIEAVARGLRAGMREWEIAALIEPEYLNSGGYAGIHFMTSMPMRAPHFPVPAQYQGDRVLEKGDVLITEISGAYWGYSGQIHRTFSLGEGPTPEWEALHDAARSCFETLAGMIREGVTTAEVEAAADMVHELGYGLYDDLLHGVNQTPPIIQSRQGKRHENRDMVFRDKMVVTIQPNVMTLDESMGLQFGETLVVGPQGTTSLNHYPREWIVCDA